MGNESSQNSLEQLKQLKNYEQVSRSAEGVIYCQKQLIQGQQTSQFFILKEHNYHSLQSYEQSYKKYKQSLNTTSQQQSNTLSIRQVMKEHIQHFCSNTYKIYTLYQFPELTLKDEIEVRAKEGKFFEECEIVAILQTCVLALEEIKATICFGSSYIFISPDGVIKVTHNDLVDENYRHVITASTYYAPEKLTNFMNQSTSEIALKKEVIFSMGMTLLEACTLEEVYHVYNYNSQTINEKKLSQQIEILAERYSNQMIQLVSNMLEINPNRRISLLEVQRALNRFDEMEMESEQLNEEEIVDKEKEELETKCDRFFVNDGNSLPRIKESTQSNEEPSVPNLLSQQTSSRMSLNTRNYPSKINASDALYQNIDKSIQDYKITYQPQPGRKSIPQTAFNVQTVQSQQVQQMQQVQQFHQIQQTQQFHQIQQTQQFHQIQQTQQFHQIQQMQQMQPMQPMFQTQPLPVPPASSQTIFTDPRLLQMIRKDLQDINKSRTSRVTMSNQQELNNSWINTSQNVSQSNDTIRNVDYQISRSDCNQYLNKSVNNIGSNGFVTLNNCPQVHSLAASVAYEGSSKKTFVYEQSDVKRHPDDHFRENDSGMAFRENDSRMDVSVALSSKNFGSVKKVDNQLKERQTARYPLRQMNGNFDPASSLSQVESQIRAAMMKKKQANLIYLQQEYQDGVRYEGMSKNGLKQGYGKLIYSDGAYYQGYFHQDKINGKGILYYKKNCPAYDGEWLDEQFNGYGELYNEEPQELDEEFPYHNWNFLENYWVKYEGDFQNDNKHGHGKIILTTGEYVQAEFMEDMLNGWGKFYKRNGDFIEGKWENNILVELANQ